ncbi:AlbA family DNA-binding domain-containing protein [Spirosoma pomorum]
MNSQAIDIDQLPIKENDYYEYKSSLTSWDKIKEKLQKAASAFANTGGGYFVVGIDDKSGDVDGGISKIYGKRPIEDWVDNIMNLVEPRPIYSVILLEDIKGRGFLKEEHAVLCVFVEESNVGPHMASDHCYYIRAGSHTVPARHFIVEAIRAKRYNAKPKLTYLLRLKPDYQQVLQLGVVAITNAPATDITISLSAYPEILEKRAHDFPISIPLIDMQNPFFFDVDLFATSGKSFPKDMKLRLEYSDVLGNKYEETFDVDLGSTPPLVIGDRDKKFLEVFKEIVKAISSIR